MENSINPELNSNSLNSIFNEKLPSARSIFGASWNFYFAKFKIIFNILILPTLFAVLSTLIAVYISPEKQISAEGIDITPPMSLEPAIVIIILNIINIIIQFFSTLAMWNFAYYGDEYIKSAKEAYIYAFKKWGLFIWVGVLVSFYVFGGFFLFLIPGVLFALWFSLASSIALFENVKGLEALARSREYIRGQIGVVYFRFFVLSLILFLFIAATNIITGILALINFYLSISINVFIFNLILIPLSHIQAIFLFKEIQFRRANKVLVVGEQKMKKLLIVPLVGILLLIAVITIFGRDLYNEILNYNMEYKKNYSRNY